jgi:hypothetical protein
VHEAFQLIFTVTTFEDLASSFSMKRLLLIRTLFPLISHGAESLHVYPPVPGLAPSEHYSVRMRAIGGEWQSAFTWQTACKKEPGYFEHLEGWTHTYVNFET